jgi:hypothetical protein
VQEYKACVAREKLGLKMKSPERYKRGKKLIQQELPADGVLFKVNKDTTRGGWKISE